MDRIKWEDKNRQHYLYIDLSHTDRTELVNIMKNASQEINESHLDDIIVITNVKDISFDKSVTKAFAEVSKTNKDHIALSAIYGAGPWVKVAIEAVGKMVDRDFYVFKSENDLKRWLNEQ